MNRGLLASAALALVGAKPWSASGPVDLVIEGGSVIDGVSPGRRVADVIVDGGRVVHVGAVEGSLEARRRVDARGLVVTPGFIDLHAHGSVEAHGRNFLAMGVTTICLGQDGQSPNGMRLAALRRRFGRAKLAVNVAPLVGHATARAQAGIGHRKNPTEADLMRLEALVDEELRDGAFGVSTALEYEPGSFATLKELVRLARPVAASDGLVMSHLRSEDDDAIDAAVDELIAQGEQSGARVHVAHIKVVTGKGTRRAERLLERLERARSRGVRVTADFYPYEASYTTLAILFPEFAKAPNSYEAARRSRRDELLAHLRERVAARGGPSATLFGTGAARGKTLARVAAERGRRFEEVLLDMGPSGGSAAYFVMDPELQARLLLDANVMVGSDGSAETHHPRGHGTFARVIREFVVERRALTLEEAVSKMAGRAADTMRLSALGRGRLEAGAAADILVFDPARVKDEATYERPRALARGMKWVFVNGEAAVAEGKQTNVRNGQLLLRR